MKKALNFLALLSLVSVGVIAARSYNSPSDAALASATVQGYLGQGFTVDEVIPNSLRYDAPQTGTYNWGTVVVRTHGRTGGAYSLETTYANVTCYIEARQQGGTVKYSVTGTDVEETVVY